MQQHDLLIIGGGPAGSAAAITAALKTEGEARTKKINPIRKKTDIKIRFLRLYTAVASSKG